MFGEIPAVLDGVSKINIIDKDATIKEFETPWNAQEKIIPDHRDYDLGPNVDQTTGTTPMRSSLSNRQVVDSYPITKR